jgi:deoxyribodipyrimidine photo-lyase
MKRYSRAICWFRRDLRLTDHAALYHALKDCETVYCVFLFDRDILEKLPDKQDRRVEFIWRSVVELHERLLKQGSAFHVLDGRAKTEIPRLARKLDVQAVYCNRDYEPDAVLRDAAVEAALGEIALHQYKDQVIFEQSEILTGSGNPYSVFTPYKNAWLKKLDEFYLGAYPVWRYASSFAQCEPAPAPSLESLGFFPGRLDIPAGESGAEALFEDFMQRIDRYRTARDFPALDGTSYLSVHLRFGTISIRRLAAHAYRLHNDGAQAWLSELIWREFYQMQLYHHPRLAEGRAFKPQFEAIDFPNDPEKFAAWCEGRTGYPLVDAAMRRLNRTGQMHNRLRMVCASFLVKDLHVDWRRGENYFAEKLLDFDLAANNGGWQWAASTGCDAQPWFRIFNPVAQSERFDPEGSFIRRNVMELASCPDRWIHEPWLMDEAERRKANIGPGYPDPIVDHAKARVIALALFKAAAEKYANPRRSS